MGHKHGWEEIWIQPELADYPTSVNDLLRVAEREQWDRLEAERQGKQEATQAELDALQVAYAALEQRAERDSLTGLYNARAFKEKMRPHLRARKPVLFFVLDLDGFKLVNDTYGHDVGDEVLIAFAEGLRLAFGRRSDALATLRSEGEVARRGGDEHYVGMVLNADGPDAPDGQGRRTADIANAVQYAYDRVSDIEAMLRKQFPGMEIGISMGHAVSDPTYFEPVEDLLRIADRGMYAHKRSKGTGRDSAAPVVVKPRPAPVGDNDAAALTARSEAA